MGASWDFVEAFIGLQTGTENSGGEFNQCIFIPQIRSPWGSYFKIFKYRTSCMFACWSGLAGAGCGCKVLSKGRRHLGSNDLHVSKSVVFIQWPCAKC